MKKIDIVTKYFLPVSGGIENSIDQTYSRLTNKGFDVTIHTSKDSYEKKGVYKKQEKIDGLVVKRSTSRLFGFYPALSVFNTDYLILHNFNLMPHGLIVIAAYLMKVIRTKKFVLIITPHGGMTPNYANLTHKEALIKKVLNKLLIKLFVNNVCDSIRAVSVWEKKRLIKLGVKKDLIRIVPDGIENEAFVGKLKVRKDVSLMAKEYKPYVIQIGKIYPTKKYETTIRALKLVDDKINLFIIGRSADSRYKFKLIKLVRELELENRVRFIDEVSVQEKYYLFRHSSLFVLTSDWESFGRVFYEALSQGLPVAVSSTSAPSEHINNDIVGYIFDNNKQEELAKVIRNVVNGNNNVKSAKRINSKFARNFAWENIADMLQKYLSDLTK